jgi:hypothetical protein
LGLFGAALTSPAPGFCAFGFWASFELRASDFAFAGLAGAGPIGFVFHGTLIFSPKTRQIGFVWRIADRDRPPPATAVALPRIINNR